ncbi:ArgE/DapE family deacylase [Holzapfeliella sp. He02]|uniref:Probable succinyl-diaminopimelate desuccinylase n=1 Tax=Holzapfeliella saturejae TaxID=3082953 RepID=A0ABU8SEI3_9LACO
MDKIEKIKILSDLIEINTVDQNEKLVADYIGNLFTQHGISFVINEVEENRATLVAEIGVKKSPKILGLSGHADTVSAGDLNKWTYNPFEATIEGDRIYGRGSSDMKSGLAAQVIALIELVEENNLPEGTVRFLMTNNEEDGASGAKVLTEQGYSKDLDGLIISEPTGGNVVYAHCGSLNYRVKSHGKAWHSSAPQNGINAITNLMAFAEKEPTLFDEFEDDPILGSLAHSITKIEGGHQINSIPEYAELSGNIRPTATASNQAIIDILTQTIEQLNQNLAGHLELEIIHDFYPVVTKPDNPLIQQLASLSTTNFNRPAELKIIHGATDASDFVKVNPTVPVAVFGPDAWENAHQVDEFTTISSYLSAITTLKQIISQFFNNFE